MEDSIFLRVLQAQGCSADMRLAHGTINIENSWRLVRFRRLPAWNDIALHILNVILGLDPRIHTPLKAMDPRVKPEDDGGEASKTKTPAKRAFGHSKAAFSP
ncbi:hypothetical protein G3A56_25195 [Rhizobium oryzihabitans]|uniref:Uncharacterized protein n=1 Tax=Rhizobium oryzihabitans TaxID=2267833 RepID=A0A7L5BQ78_9HYPH|nr:hypothetical protein [Rhizobium oryzihabitans]QCM08113.1 hypothetical protein CFBP6626_22870 [Agrobacterium tumefaciens]QIB41077.1 hypothetical protein G3A56_25195 [Rhizobium oryzihabitans]